MPQALVLCNFPSRNAVDISVEVQEKIRGLLRGLAENKCLYLPRSPKQIFEVFGEQNPAYIRVKIRPSRKFLRQGSVYVSFAASAKTLSTSRAGKRLSQTPLARVADQSRIEEPTSTEQRDAAVIHSR